jgi:uroporphyrinogen-III decarboxylase
MMDYYDDTEFIHALAEFTVKNALKFATAQIEAGADIIGLGDAAASLIGRELYDEFVFPHEKWLVDGIHAAGAKVRLHICGRAIQLADAIAKLGCEIVDLDTMVDLKAARAAMGDRQVLLGNVHTVNAVKNGTVDDMRRELAKCRADAGIAWIAGAGCELPRHSPAENVRCFAEVL